tara:strand:+ start:403 stop:846 length:444 start_codon:yes stop_codon:yes gene_type:complete
MNKSMLAAILIGSATLVFAPATQADPPRWSGAYHSDRDDHWRDYHDERKKYLKGNYRKHEQRKRYRHRDYLYHRPARGPAYVFRPAPGWHSHAFVGQRLPHDFYRYRYYLPRHAKIRRLHSGVTELIIADQIIRILDATQTIINVRR